MKVKLLTSGGYIGIAEAVGEVFPAKLEKSGSARILGEDLLKAGAEEFWFNKDNLYLFLKDEVEVLEED